MKNGGRFIMTGYAGQAFCLRVRVRGTRVNAVAPGVIDTDMSRFVKTEAGREQVLPMQALRRIGQPVDVADVITVLASDRARWVTGQTIPAGGGCKLSVGAER